MNKFVNQRIVNSTPFSKKTKKIIEEMTHITNSNSLTPELSLHLITPNCRLWRARYEECPFPDPFWAFYWPGGQGLTRYVLDNKSIIHGKTILDLGSGCGSLAIAAARVGVAASITANDIDPIAAVAVQLNATLNHCKPNSVNIVGNSALAAKYDCIMLGDMFYDEKFTFHLMKWLLSLLKTGTQIFIGDPNRHSMFQEDYKNNIEQVAEYGLSDEFRKIHDLTSTTINVWRLIREC